MCALTHINFLVRSNMTAQHSRGANIEIEGLAHKNSGIQQMGKSPNNFGASSCRDPQNWLGAADATAKAWLT